MSIFSPRQQLARPLGASYAYRDGTLGMTTFNSGVVDADVKAYQAMMNTSLAKMGFSQIAVDGKLGPGTCGASHLFDTMPESFDTAAANWNDDLANQVHNACDGQAYTVPLLANKTSAYVQGNTDPTCVNSPQKLPGGGLSAGTTLAFQQLANTQLVANGYNPLTIDSTLGPATCGAMKLLDQIAGTGYLCQYGANCTSFTLPTKKAVASSPASPSAAPASAPTLAPSTSNASMLMKGGLVLAALGGLYYIAKKKGMV